MLQWCHSLYRPRLPLQAQTGRLQVATTPLAALQQEEMKGLGWGGTASLETVQMTAHRNSCYVSGCKQRAVL